MSTTGHEKEAVNVEGLKAALKSGGNKAIFNEAICSTAGGTVAKVTNTTPPSFSLVSGAKIIVKFTYGISVANATLQVGNTAAKPIHFRGAALEANIVKPATHLLLSYDGTAYNIIGGLGGGSEVEIGETAPTEDVKLFVDEDADPAVSIDVYTRAQVDAKVADTVHLSAQTLTDAQKAQARTNIGAGTSSFSGSYNDLSNKPTIPTVSQSTGTSETAVMSQKTVTEELDGKMSLSGGTLSNNIRDILYLHDTSGGGSYITFDNDKCYVGYNSSESVTFFGCRNKYFKIHNDSYFSLNDELIIQYQYPDQASSDDYPLIVETTGESRYESSIKFIQNGTASAVVGGYNDGAFLYCYGSNTNVHLNNYGYFVCPSRLSVGAGESPSYMLHVAGAVGATGFTNTSDIRKKDIIENLNLDVEDIAKAPIFKFTWLDPEMPEGINVGTSAQYWQTFIPEIVSEANDDEKTLSMQYGVAALASSVSLAKKVVEQEDRIKALEDTIKELQNKLK